MHGKLMFTKFSRVLMAVAAALSLAGTALAQGSLNVSPEPSPSAPAEEGGYLKTGPFKVRGGLELGWQHRSNIYLSENNEVSDNIYMVKPSVGVRQDFTSTSFWSLEYYGTWAMYGDNNNNNWNSHFIPFDFYLGGEKGPNLTISNDFWRSSDPYGSDNLYRLGQQTARTQNTFFIAPGYKFGEKLSAEVFFRYIILEYDLNQDRAQNQREYNYGGKAYYKIMPKTSLVGQYTYVTRDYTDQAESTGEDFKRQDFLVGVAWDATAKLNGEAKIGYSQQDYDNNRNAVGNKYEETSDFAMEINLVYAATPKINLFLDAFRGIKESTAFGSNYYLDTYGTLGARWAALEKLSVYGLFSYGTNDYNSTDGTSAREDKVYKFEAGVEYSFLQWLYAIGKYTYDKRDSNKTNLSYNDNVWYVGIGGKF